jgi:hypothetical protein
VEDLHVGTEIRIQAFDRIAQAHLARIAMRGEHDA